MDWQTPAAILSALAALAAGFWAWRSERSAASVAAIDRDRRHEELTPKFALSLKRLNGVGDTFVLEVKLVGPDGLERLDGITVIVADDKARGASPLANGPTKEEVGACIWGPLRFRPGIEGTGDGGRTSALGALDRGTATVANLEPSAAPTWFEDQRGAWRAQYEDSPLKLRLECHLAGQTPWTVPQELKIPPEPRMPQRLL
jgi:hypothetical protein